MDSIISKIVDTFKIPGIILGLIYFFWQQKGVSVINSSEIERILFSQEKKLIYKFSLYIKLYIFILILLSILSTLSLNLIQSFKFLLSFKYEILLHIIYGVININALIFYILKKCKKIDTFQKKISSSSTLQSIITMFYMLSSVLYFAFLISKNVNNHFPKDTEVYIVISSLINSLFIPSIILFLISPYINKEKTYFSFNIDNELWYLLKPTNDNEVIIGNDPIEEKCSKIKFISLSDLKQKELLISKKTEE